MAGPRGSDISGQLSVDTVNLLYFNKLQYLAVMEDQPLQSFSAVLPGVYSRHRRLNRDGCSYLK
jgi:hypothetical protein